MSDISQQPVDDVIDNSTNNSIEHSANIADSQAINNHAEDSAKITTNNVYTSNVAVSLRWRAADIALGAALAAAFGVIFWGFNFAYFPISGFFKAILPGLVSVTHAIWYFSGPVALLLIRKPGAAIYVNIVGGIIETLLGNSFNVTFVIVSALLQGIASEIPFALTRYRKYTLPLTIAAGALTAVEYAFYLLFFRYHAVSLFSVRGTVHVISEIVGGVLIAGVFSWFLFRAIQATGALNHFASGRDNAQLV